MSRIKSAFERLNGEGRKALIPFITAGDPDAALTLPLMHTLVEAGADVNSSSENGTTPLIAAARSGYAEVVKLLLSRRANPNLKLDTGETALDVALKTNNTDIADMLRKAGAVSGRSVTIEVR